MASACLLPCHMLMIAVSAGGGSLHTRYKINGDEVKWWYHWYRNGTPLPQHPSFSTAATYTTCKQNKVILIKSWPVPTHLEIVPPCKRYSYKTLTLGTKLNGILHTLGMQCRIKVSLGPRATKWDFHLTYVTTQTDSSNPSPLAITIPH